MKEPGYVEGSSYVIVPRYANNDFTRLPKLVEGLAAQNIDVLVTRGPTTSYVLPISVLRDDRRRANGRDDRVSGLAHAHAPNGHRQVRGTREDPLRLRLDRVRRGRRPVELRADADRQHRKVLAAIFTKPTLDSIVFADIEALLAAVGCEVEEGAGSRVAFIRGKDRLCMHRPHPGKEAKRYQVEAVREFLETQGIRP